MLTVHGTEVVRMPNKSVYREFFREYMIPENINPDMIVPRLSSDGHTFYIEEAKPERVIVV